MTTKIKCAIVMGTIVLFCCLFSLSLANARMVVPTQLVSGTITAVEDGVIELQGGEEYHPANIDIDVNLNAGSNVTIRYVTGPDGTKKYVEIAPGIDTLSPKDTPSEDPENKELR